MSDLIKVKTIIATLKNRYSKKNPFPENGLLTFIDNN